MEEKAAPEAASNDLPQTTEPRDAGSISSAAPAIALTNAAEIRLTAEKAYFEQIIENAPEAISIVDARLRILRINGEFTRLFGFTATEAAERPLDELIVPPDRYAETAWINECIKTQSKVSLRLAASAKTAPWSKCCSPPRP